jgi:hypothetical protein
MRKFPASPLSCHSNGLRRHDGAYFEKPLLGRNCRSLDCDLGEQILFPLCLRLREVEGRDLTIPPFAKNAKDGAPVWIVGSATGLRGGLWYPTSREKRLAAGYSPKSAFIPPLTCYGGWFRNEKLAPWSTLRQPRLAHRRSRGRPVERKGKLCSSSEMRCALGKSRISQMPPPRTTVSGERTAMAVAIA